MVTQMAKKRDAHKNLMKDAGMKWLPENIRIISDRLVLTVAFHRPAYRMNELAGPDKNWF
jgi:hypothetical protein